MEPPPDPGSGPSLPANGRENSLEPDPLVATLRTSVGEFALQPAPAGCHLEIIVGHVRRIIGSYATNEEALHALINRRTGFRAWDALRGRTAVTQVNALKRWERSQQPN